MAQSIKTITDKARFETIFKNYFANKDVFIKTKSGNITVHFLGYLEENVAFRIPHVKNIKDSITVFLRHQSHTIYALLKFLERNEDTFIFLPVKMQVISEERKEDRMLVGSEGGTNVIYLTGVMSDLAIKNEIMVNDKKVEHVKEIVQFDLQKQFDNVKVYFISEGKSDQRMKSLVERDRPIFVPDLNTDPPDKLKDDYHYYINEIYSKDYRLSSVKEYISEALVPILYKGIIPYGYLQVNNKLPLTDGLFAVVKRMGVVISELFRKYNLFIPADDRFLVSDLSRNGIGIAFKDRRQTRFFRQDGLVLFEVLLPTQKKAVIGAIVKNVNFLENGVIKVGMQIHKMDPISEVNYEEFLDEMQ
ncbi:MAG TPA: hypothetical protein PK926_11230 [Spirochaetota bacterium]|nr:hypothetical protein [Spirochaetota bacterium]HPI91080.1 hypothetical protein [Spirochaetota bacterium]HPR47739.1 hypothetical protein [Spirochaetota bacterium]